MRADKAPVLPFRAGVLAATPDPIGMAGTWAYTVVVTPVGRPSVTGPFITSPLVARWKIQLVEAQELAVPAGVSIAAFLTAKLVRLP